MRRSGFTVLQMVLIIVLISALSVFVGVNIWNAVTTFRLNSAAAKLMSDISYTQHMARTHGAWYGIDFQVNPTNQYTVYHKVGTQNVPVTDPLNQAVPLVINVAQSFGNVTISNINIDGSTAVMFDGRGVPYLDPAGTALPAAGATITLAKAGSQKIITIQRNTGRVGIQ